jgi:hypothetical protein
MLAGGVICSFHPNRNRSHNRDPVTRSGRRDRLGGLIHEYDRVAA